MKKTEKEMCVAEGIILKAKGIFEAVALKNFGSKKDFDKEKMVNLTGGDHPFGLPWNLAKAGAPWNICVHEADVPALRARYESDGPVKYAAKFAGWLKVAGTKKGLVKILMATTSPSGMGSERTTVSPFLLFEAIGSPQKLEGLIWQMKKTADKKLKPYGLKVSWESIGWTIVYGQRDPYLAARRTVLKYLRYYCEYFRMKENGVFSSADGLSELMKEKEAYLQRWAVITVFVTEKKFKTLREALANSYDFFVEEIISKKLFLEGFTPGDILYREKEAVENIHGVKIFACWPQHLTEDCPRCINMVMSSDGKKKYLTEYHGRIAVKKALKFWKRETARNSSISNIPKTFKDLLATVGE